MFIIILIFLFLKLFFISFRINQRMDRKIRDELFKNSFFLVRSQFWNILLIYKFHLLINSKWLWYIIVLRNLTFKIIIFFIFYKIPSTKLEIIVTERIIFVIFFVVFACVEFIFFYKSQYHWKIFPWLNFLIWNLNSSTTWIKLFIKVHKCVMLLSKFKQVWLNWVFRFVTKHDNCISFKLFFIYFTFLFLMKVLRHSAHIWEQRCLFVPSFWIHFSIRTY